MSYLGAFRFMELVERRRAARYSIKLTGKLLTALEEEVSVCVINLSFSGIQVQVSTEYAKKLFPNLSRDHPIDTVQFDLTMSLPGAFDSIEVRIGVVYLKRASSEDMILGCRFENFYNDSADELSGFLASIDEHAKI